MRLMLPKKIKRIPARLMRELVAVVWERSGEGSRKRYSDANANAAMGR